MTPSWSSTGTGVPSASALLRSSSTPELDVEFKEPLAQALEKKLTAKKVWEEARDAAALSATLATPREIPLGTRVEEWSAPKGWGYSREKKSTGRRGVLEVITATSEHPDNVPSYRRASVGDVVVRILKKDGTPSKKYVKGAWKHRERMAALRDAAGGGGRIMSNSRFEVVEIKTGKVVHICPHQEVGSNVQRVMLGLMNNIGRFDARLSRPFDPERYPEQEGYHEDNRLDTDRFFVHSVED
jgi:hypothetical protein